MSQMIIGVIMLGAAAILTWFGGQFAAEGWKTWRDSISEKKSEPFGVNFIVPMIFRWPGPLLFVYPSGLGNTISPVSIALYVEVVNKRTTVSRVYNYSCRALLRYEEGGSVEAITTPNGGTKLEYRPSGKTVEKWRKLHSMSYVDAVYYVASDDWSKSKKIDFSRNSFEMIARNKQLNPGESLMGWMTFELEDDLRVQVPEVLEWELTLVNSAGESQVARSVHKPSADPISHISAGQLHFLAGYYDLSKEHYTLVPMMDVPKIVKGDK